MKLAHNLRRLEQKHLYKSVEGTQATWTFLNAKKEKKCFLCVGKWFSFELKKNTEIKGDSIPSFRFVSFLFFFMPTYNRRIYIYIDEVFYLSNIRIFIINSYCTHFTLKNHFRSFSDIFWWYFLRFAMLDNIIV